MDSKRQQLVALGPERLADALLELAGTSREADDLVQRLAATPAERVKRFKAKLAGLKRRRGFTDWRAARGFARELEGMLEDLRSGVQDPVAGLGLVAAFYETDKAVFESCDDSSGVLGDVFRRSAREIFAEYAGACPDKESAMECLTELYAHDGYGVRGYLLDVADRFLDRERLKDLARRFLSRAGQEASDPYQAGHWSLGARTLARAARDAPLFEAICRASRDELGEHDCQEIAETYLDSGDAETALAWLDRVPAESDFRAQARGKLRLRICQKLGRREAMEKIAWGLFRHERTCVKLAALLDIIGQDQRDAVVAAEALRILEGSRLSYADAAFLVEVGRLDEAEQYLQTHAAELDGDLYNLLLPLAKAMEEQARPLTASLIYRALIDSILARAQSKYYPYAVRHLKKLLALASAVKDWRVFPTHPEYEVHLRQTHARKSAFWAAFSR